MTIYYLCSNRGIPKELALQHETFLGKGSNITQTTNSRRGGRGRESLLKAMAERHESRRLKATPEMREMG